MSVSDRCGRARFARRAALSVAAPCALLRYHSGPAGPEVSRAAQPFCSIVSTMNDEQIAIYRAMLETKRLVGTCPCCDQNDWEYVGERIHFDLGTSGDDEDTLVLICRSCGYVRRHLVRPLMGTE